MGSRTTHRRALAALALALAPGASFAEFRSVGDRPAILYDAPSARADKLFAVTRLYPFEVLVKLDQWTKVRDANGEVGWIENGALGDRATAVVTVAVADVRARPDPQAPLVFEAYKQVLLEILEPAANGWVKVRHRDGQEGYVRVSHVWGA
ncbi:MAG TPA: SH3 domain-containing protein [Usitatibacter sp.]|nr:SH3 domain-containing protein [Usitatibacter sp.]